MDDTSLTLLLNACKDQNRGVRQVAFRALGKLQAVDALSSTVLLNATQDQDSDVRQAAVSALAKIPTEQYIDGYWATKDQLLIPYISYRLYQTPLVIDQGRATLYLQAGQYKTWPKPDQKITSEDMDHFAQLLQKEKLFGKG